MIRFRDIPIIGLVNEDLNTVEICQQNETVSSQICMSRDAVEARV